jgi:hypothetical protein
MGFKKSVRVYLSRYPRIKNILNEYYKLKSDQPKTIEVIWVIIEFMFLSLVVNLFLGWLRDFAWSYHPVFYNKVVPTVKLPVIVGLVISFVLLMVGYGLHPAFDNRLPILLNSSYLTVYNTNSSWSYNASNVLEFVNGSLVYEKLTYKLRRKVFI